jgi:bifunctional pyridoxal-dependent enzyme with beta-cystathionase and maltose regulon repressor activities
MDIEGMDSEDLEAIKDEIYRKLLRAEFGYSGAREELAEALALCWSSCDLSQRNAVLEFLKAVSPGALSLVADSAEKHRLM